MAFQLIFTSVPAGLAPGRTGYCTVARHKGIRTRLVSRLETLSTLENHLLERWQGQPESPIHAINAFRQLEIGQESYFALSRIVAAGRDFTNRTNYLAHHLIFEETEIEKAASPAEIFMNWKGWRNNWPDLPKYFDESDLVDANLLRSSSLLPAKCWKQHTGDSGNAAIPVSPAMKTPILITCPPDRIDLIPLFAESSVLHGPGSSAWRFTFTSDLQSTDEVSDFEWMGAEAGSPVVHRRESAMGTVLDLAKVDSSQIEENLDERFVVYARTGRKPAAPQREKSRQSTPARQPPLEKAKKSPPRESSPVDSQPRTIHSLKSSVSDASAYGRPPAKESQDHPPSEKPISVETSFRTEGQFACLMCWLKFNEREIKHITAHPELVGDDKLGPDAPTRFIPTSFNDDGEPLDALGVLAPDIACPHCHGRLPQGFTEFPHHIFSLVGAPSCGKSNYLAILRDQLPRALFQKLNVSFSDQDPEFNLALNTMSRQILAASTVAEACLDKTLITGAEGFHTVVKDGKTLELPSPYVFFVSDLDNDGNEFSLCFYDNAGEHFLPMHVAENNSHIQHLKRAASLLFMFDPVSNNEFRKKLRHEDAPQWQLEYPDSQDVILSQMHKEMADLGAFAKRTLAPLAVILAKSDLWMDHMPHSAEIENPVTEDGLDLAIVDKNSDICRDFMIEMSTGLVSNSERIAEDVRYFPVSTFGHKAVRAEKNAQGEVKIGPDPKRLKPFHVEVPVIWALSKLSENLIPTK